ncbi:DUF1501 domain-containing protein [Ruegeria sp. 2205SS24-7]|uniref:DUF1501 domain-containing protein n=1 Tax=Ruegeria discodermiae TaxID=3064389 RepID=UPI002741D7D4|nr:DUF1501 domain-containing protein [Ruegeria sp. 2205SS24-7]MDP5219256.1 DUF1501 domain-containing protein [Ruegeria sp. 2205SS24-7]
MALDLTRRSFLTRSALIGCSAAASPLLTRVSFAAAPWDTRLVVIILRGGMDALDVVRPLGDPDYTSARAGLLRQDDPVIDLDGFYALHPGLQPLLPLWRAGEFGAVQAVATPYRDKRSHFDGQDLLEAGSTGLGDVAGGWLNRALGQVPGVSLRTGFALGHGEMKVLAGDTAVTDWYPDTALTLSPQAALLAEQMMAEDPLFHGAYAQAMALMGEGQEGETATNGAAKGKRRLPEHVNIASYAAEQLRGDARVVGFSLNGWDTHRAQTKGLTRALKRLSQTILTLKRELGAPVWGKTVVLAMTEFGRTVRQNGTGGTDHGTGGALLFAGGAVRGGQVLGDWPGLQESALLDRRDLMPTADLRAYVAGVLQGVAGLDRAALEGTVFPGLDMDGPTSLLL